MDELEFRRRAYGNPQDQEPDFLTAVKGSRENAQLVASLKNLDLKLEKALKVEVPETLADKLILRQQLTTHHKKRRRMSYVMAMAASIGLVVAVSFGYLRFGPVELGEHALAHIYHEPNALISNLDIALSDVNASLANLQGLEHTRFNDVPGQIVYKAYCDFLGVRSLHLVLENPEGKVSLFIIPQEDRMKLNTQFADAKYQGLGFKRNDAFMLLVSEQSLALQMAADSVRHSFI